jgi:ribonuclease HII
MVIAGIDEAGYGPVLGSMCIGCCALHVEAVSPVEDLWKRLSRAVSRSRDATGKRIHVNDSKKVYTPSAGVGELERAILTLVGSRQALPGDESALLDLVAGDSVPDLLALPWYAVPAGHRFPHVVDPMSLKIATNHLKHEFARAAVRVEHLHSFVVPETRLNQLFDATRNKSSTSFSFVVRHIALLLDRYADAGLTIYCDRQGGREHYASLLRQMFEDWSLTVESETSDRAEYSLVRHDRTVTMIFQEKAEQACMSVAIASMLAKYLREIMMHRFNAYWKQRAPTLKPTAGYWTDGQRFIEELKATNAADPEVIGKLVRSR